MKKRILLITLLCLIFNVSSVSAMNQYSSFKANLIHTAHHDIDIPIGAQNTQLVTEEGNTYQYEYYYSYTNYIQVPGDTKKYPAFCIDPGKGVNDTTLTCELLDAGNYPMLHAAASDKGLTGGDFATADLVFRILGIMERASVVYTNGGNLGAFKAKSNNVALTITWHQAALDAGVISEQIHPANIGYLPTSGTFMAARSKVSSLAHYWSGAAGGGDTYSASEHAGDQSTASYPTGKYFTLSRDGGTDDEPIYKVTTVGGKKATDVQITAGAGSHVDVITPWNGTYARFSIYGIGKNCTNNGKANVTGVIPGEAVTDDETPYMCVGSGDTQSFVALMPGNNGDKFENIPVKCQNCPEQTKYPKREQPQKEERVEKNYAVTSIAMCCTDNGSGKDTSKSEEYKLDQLFISDKNTYEEATYFTNMCNNNTYKDKEMESALGTYVGTLASGQSVETYCNVYCTEKIEITTPSKHITSANGKYFRLSEPNPKVEGERRCTIKIDYRTLRSTYEHAVNGPTTDGLNPGNNDGEIPWFNQYQKDKSKEEMIHGYSTDDITFTQTPTNVKFKKQVCKSSTTVGNGSTKYGYSNDDPCGEGGSSTGTCTCQPAATCTCPSYSNDWRYEEDTVPSCTFNYKVFTLNPPSYVTCQGGKPGPCVVKAYQVKSKNEFKFSSNSFTGLEIINTGSPVDVNYWKYTRYIEPGARQPCIDNVTNVKNKAQWSTWTPYDGGKYKDWKDEHINYHTSNTEKIYNTLVNQTIPNDVRQFDKMKLLADDLEKINVKCESFLDNVANPYSMNPTGNFHYMQVFLNEEKNKTGQEFTVPFSPSCSTPSKDNSFPEGGATEVVSDKFKGGTEPMTDIANFTTSTPSLRSTGALPPMHATSNWEKYLRRNKRFYQVCDWGDSPANVQMTLYPGPTISGYDTSGLAEPGSDSGTSVGHVKQYALYLTTYKGQYQTWWDIHNLGSSRTIQKFTQEFNTKGTTCANAGKALSKGQAEKYQSSTNTVPFTCYIDVRLGGMRIGECGRGVSDSLPCTDPYNVNEVYEFRVVDTKDPFPNSSKWISDGLAKNWRTGTTGDGGFGKTYAQMVALGSKDKTYLPENMTYSFRLNTTTMNSIKTYNKSHDYNYFDTTVRANPDLCECQSGPEEHYCGIIHDGNTGYGPDGSCGGGTTWTYRCKKCKSTFLDTYASKAGVWNTPKYNNKFSSIDAVRSDNKANSYISGIHSV